MALMFYVFKNGFMPLLYEIDFVIMENKHRY